MSVGTHCRISMLQSSQVGREITVTSLYTVDNCSVPLLKINGISLRFMATIGAWCFGNALASLSGNRLY